LACPSCARRFQHQVHIKVQAMAKTKSSQYESSETEINTGGTQNGNAQ
jgi:hypothetical protein